MMQLGGLGASLCFANKHEKHPEVLRTNFREYVNEFIISISDSCLSHEQIINMHNIFRTWVK